MWIEMLEAMPRTFSILPKNLMKNIEIHIFFGFTVFTPQTPSGGQRVKNEILYMVVVFYSASEKYYKNNRNTK